MKKLPENIKLVITRGNEECEDWKVEQFLQALLKEVELREIHSSRNNHSSSEVKRKPDVTTASALFMKKNTLECAFCRLQKSGRFGKSKKRSCKNLVDVLDALRRGTGQRNVEADPTARGVKVITTNLYATETLKKSEHQVYMLGQMQKWEKNDSGS